jgi:alginate O-acetyltransferase complex protein AlgI
MQYSSFGFFVLFLLPSAIVYFAVPKKYRWISLLGMSLIFYWLSSAYLIFVLLITAFLTYLAGIFIGKIDKADSLARPSLPKDIKKEYRSVVKWQKKAVVALIIVFDFGMLVFIKYFNYIASLLNIPLSLFGDSGILLPSLSWLKMPLGISFYTLMAVSYVTDVYRGKYPPCKNFFRVLLYLCFFPSIMEGPFCRFDNIDPQLVEGHDFSLDRLSGAVSLVCWGLFKKIVIADRANIFVNEIFTNYTNYSGVVVLSGALLYTLQIYCDFSGVIDVVRGVSEIFGIQLPQNFSRPFFSKNVSEFWRRWHITLGAWIKDYIFYPLTLSKVPSKISRWAQKHFNNYIGRLLPTVYSLFFVWMFNGIWHGSGTKYVCYGLYYFFISLVGMLLEPLNRKFFEKTKMNRNGRFSQAVKILRTFILVVFGMMLFRATDVSVFLSMFFSMFTSTGTDVISSGAIFTHGADIHDLAVLIAGAVIIFIVGILQEKGCNFREKLSRKSTGVRFAVISAAILIVLIYGAYGGTYVSVDPIYANF